MSIDRPTKVRSGEELPLDRLGAHLEEHLGLPADQLAVEQFPSGYSNLTYCLKYDDREFVLRRPPFGANVKSGHDMSREWRILSALEDFGRAPRPVLMCNDDDVIGAQFYVMERVNGVILRGTKQELGEEDMSKACDALVRTLVDIHSIDLDASGLQDFGRPEGYVQRQVEGWTRRWEKSKTDDLPQMDTTARWLADNMPSETAATLIHNDYKYDNVVYSPEDFGTVSAVLDWELATVGDPLMDLGTSLAYWIEDDDNPLLQSVAGPTARPGNLERAEVAARYAELSGRKIDEIVFYYVQGLFKVGVIGQQIYYRYKHGHTSDERFAGLIFLVQASAQRAMKAIESGKI